MTISRIGFTPMGLLLFAFASAAASRIALAEESVANKMHIQANQNTVGAGKSTSIAASRSRLLPVFESQGNEFLGLSLVNRAAVANEVTINWTSAGGNSTRSARLLLPPGSQRAQLVREILGMAQDPTDGWIQVDAAESGLFCWLSSGNDRLLDGAEPAIEKATILILDHVAVHTGFVELEYTDTWVHLINPNDASASVGVALLGLDGVVSGTLTVSILPRASRTLRISETFRDSLPSNNLGGRDFRGYLRVVSDLAVAGWLQIDTPLSRRLIRGQAIEETAPSRLAMAAYFAAGSAALYRSELNLINAGDTAATLELSARDSRGGDVGEAIRRTLMPGQGMREDVMSLFRVVVAAVFPPPMITGYIRIRSADGGVFRLLGDIGIASGRFDANMLYPITIEPSAEWLLPFAVSGPVYFTGYAVANPNELLTVQTNVTIELFDHEGRLTGPPRNVSLSPSAQFVSLVEQDIGGGYLRIQSSAPVVVLGSIGTRSGSTLSPLPGMK